MSIFTSVAEPSLLAAEETFGLTPLHLVILALLLVVVVVAARSLRRAARRRSQPPGSVPTGPPAGVGAGLLPHKEPVPTPLVEQRPVVGGGAAAEQATTAHGAAIANATPAAGDPTGADPEAGWAAAGRQRASADARLAAWVAIAVALIGAVATVIVGTGK